MAILTKLQHCINKGDLYEDGAQIAAAKALDEMLLRLESDPPRKTGFFSKRWVAPKGLYMWGGVGRGKSMLMDWFFEVAPLEAKSRVHSFALF